MDSPMVGRDRQLRQLLDAAERAQLDRAPQLVTVLGLAGVGKSRLVARVPGRASDGPRRSSAAGASRMAMRSRTGHSPRRCAPRPASSRDDPTGRAIQRLRAWSVTVPQAELVVQRVAGAIGLATDDTAVPSTARRRSGLFAGSSRSMARRRPLVAVFDDVQWATPTFLDLLEHITDWSRDAPILAAGHRAARAARGPADVGRRQDERDHAPARAARRRGGRPDPQQPAGLAVAPGGACDEDRGRGRGQPVLRGRAPRRCSSTTGSWSATGTPTA